MNTSTILFISYALSHANPCLVMAEELAGRGHHVKFAMPEEGAQWVKDKRIEFISWEPEVSGGERLTRLQRRVRAEAATQPCWYRGQYLVTQSMTDTYVTIFRTLQSLVVRVKPNIIVTPQTTVPAMDVAIQAGVPLVIEAFYLPPGVRKKFDNRGSDVQPRVSLTARLENLLYRQLLRAAWGRHDQVRRNCSNCAPYGKLLRQHCVISGTHECVEGNDTFLPNVHLSGPLIAGPRPLPVEIERWLDENREPGAILVAFGTLVRLKQQQINALATGLQQTGRPILWALPAAQQRMLPPLPTSIRIEPFVDQRSVLAHPAVCAFFSHGGANSFMESMLCGKPLLVSAFSLDQPFYARRAAELGVGIPVDGHRMISSAVRDASIRLVSDATFTINARRLSNILQTAPGAANAAQIVENMLEDKFDAPTRQGTLKDRVD